MAIASVFARELLAVFFPDTRLFYVITILIVYGAGTFVSFRLQEAIAFARVPAYRRRESVIAFYGVAVFVGVLTAGLAALLRYPLGFERIFTPFGAATSYAASTLLTSVLSWYLASRLVFKEWRSDES